MRAWLRPSVVPAVLTCLLAGQGAAALRPRYGATIVRGFVGGIRTLDPIAAQSRIEREAALQVHAGLFRMDGSGQPEPDLVERAELTGDGLGVKLTLRPAWFHDGRPVRAEDARASLERGAAAGLAVALLRTAGAEPTWCRASGERELYLSIAAAPALWSAILADPALAILPATATAAAGEVGAGPFRVLRRAGDGRSLELGAFERHPRGRPLLDSLVYRAFADDAALLLALRHQGADVAELETAPAELLQVRRGRELIALELNARRAPLDSIAVREAVARAIRTDALVEVVLAGRAEAASGLLVPRGAAGSGGAGSAGPAGAPLRPDSRPLRLLYPEEGQRVVAERLRVDLFAAGIRSLAERGETEDWDLRLVALPDPGSEPLLGLAAAFRAVDREPTDALRAAALGRPGEPAARELVAAERELLDPVFLVPLYRRATSLVARPGVLDLAAGEGLARFEDAWRWPRAAPAGGPSGQR